MTLHEELEEKIAELKGTEAALVFNSGFQANTGILSTLVGEGDLILSDTLNHASIIDGCRLSRAKTVIYGHCNMDQLEFALKQASHDGRKLIVTESLFSMDADEAPLADIVSLAEKYGAMVMVDEAHATGVLGPRGMGLCAAFPDKVDLVMGTFSKALGSYGAYVACSQVLRDYLINRMTGLIYSTALPPGVLGAIDAALDLVPSMDAERANLARSGERVRQVFKSAGLDCGLSTTQIIPLVLGDEERVMSFGTSLEEQGVLGVPIRPPTVPQGTSRIRFALSAAHDEASIDHLIGSVTELAAKQMAPA